MNQTTVHAIFDIGKTNKKLFLFDEKGKIAWRTTTTFPTIEDEDGFPSDDLGAIENWMIETMTKLMENGFDISTMKFLSHPRDGTRDSLIKDSPNLWPTATFVHPPQLQWNIKSINFSGYGASLVYLDDQGKRLPFFINYLHPYPEELERSFFEKYGPKSKFCQETASPWLGMLNSGLQIYWLKYVKPEWFNHVKYILHFPQYLSYLFSNTAMAEYTSIGCHTGMWNYQKQDYHQWIYEENIKELLPPIVPSSAMNDTLFSNQLVQVGTGLHDTSASLIPYLKSEKESFILLSTGTWALAVNPFSRDTLSSDDLINDCLNFLRIDGNQVRTARLFLGREHEIQVDRLSKFYGLDKQDVLNLKWDPEMNEKAKNAESYACELVHLKAPDWPIKKANDSPAIPTEWPIPYYQLMNHLVSLQIEAIHRAAGSQDIRVLIIEGGFVHNNLYVELLRHGLPDWEVRNSDIKGGSARGVYELVKHTI